jgi:hypothetical protein
MAATVLKLISEIMKFISKFSESVVLNVSTVDLNLCIGGITDGDESPYIKVQIQKRQLLRLKIIFESNKTARRIERPFDGLVNQYLLHPHHNRHLRTDSSNGYMSSPFRANIKAFTV